MIVKNHGVVVIEDLKVTEMTKSGKGTVENPGELVQKRANKAPWFGSRIIVVDPAHTSQCCSACSPVDAASRISRSRFVCTNCGSIFDADVNAAKDILKGGSGPGLADFGKNRN